MKVKANFQFSASSLQDYLDCPQRFELRYLEKVKWPALVSEPVLEYEMRLEMGRRFHELVYQHQLGLAPEQISPHIDYPALSVWWQNYLQSDLMRSLPARRYPELSLSLPFQAFRIMAKFDLLAVQPGSQAVIVDWKTSARRARSSRIKSRLQSILYPYVLVEAGASLNSKKMIQPGQVSMIYWFTDFPEQPEIIKYDENEHQKSGRILQELVAEIATLSSGEFSKTESEEHCKFCCYRSLCNRGIQAGDWRSIEEDLDATDGSTILFDEIGEFAF